MNRIIRFVALPDHPANRILQFLPEPPELRRRRILAACEEVGDVAGLDGISILGPTAEAPLEAVVLFTDFEASVPQAEVDRLPEILAGFLRDNAEACREAAERIEAWMAGQ